MNTLKSSRTRTRLLAMALMVGVLVAVPALAVMVIVAVTPNSLDRGPYVFSVSTNAVSDGVAFQIAIHLKKGSPASSSTHAGLYFKLGHGGNISYGDKQPNGRSLPAVALTQRGRDWAADFVASDELLQSTNLCFTYMVQPNVFGVSGERVLMPGGEIYELNLRDFLRP